MNLKRQFALLFTGILFIPFLTIAITVGIFQLGDIAEQMVFDLRKDSVVIDQWLLTERSQPLENLSNPNVVIFDDTGALLNDPPQKLSAEQYMAQYDTVSVWLGPEDRKAQVLHLFEKNSLDALSTPPLTMLLVPSMLLLFVAAMSIWILSTLQRKLKSLVSSTQRIGQGDLNTEVTVPGNDELARFAQSLDVMRLQLKQSGEDRKRLLMGISHDLKTPLSGIKGYVQALLDGLAPDEDKRDQYLNIIADKSNLLEQRIASLIEYVKLESADWSLKTSEVKVQAITEQWFAEFENDLSVSGFHCSVFNNMPHGTSCQFDTALVRRALDNLIGNAMKYSPSDSSIALRADLKKAHYCFEIENEGEAFSETEREKLFSPFFRGDKGRNTEGLGLGLTVVEKVAQLHGGEIQYDYSNGKHHFLLMIPLYVS